MTQKILIAEDEMIIAFDLCDTVEEAGFHVEGPYSGISSAMLAFQKEKPALAILDVDLADGDVFGLAKTMAAEDVPIIFHTGSLSREQVEARFPGAQTMMKPVPPTAMLEAVTNILVAPEATH
ncbi:MAG: response regulator [Erythrobacter sp.]